MCKENFYWIGLTMLLLGGFGRIITQLGKIELKILYFYLNVIFLINQ